MTLTAANVDAYGTGAVYRAPVGTALPTSADDLINVAFEDHGYISQDGVAETIDEQTTDVYAWQNVDLVRKLQTTHDVTYAFSALEVNETTLTSYYGVNDGSNVTTATDTTIEVRGGQGVRAPWVLDFIDGDKRHVRVVIPDGQVTARGGVTRNATNAVEMPITITAYPDSTGTKAYIYVDSTPVDSA